MVLEKILSDIGVDTIFVVGALVADDVSTYIAAHRAGIDAESAIPAKEAMYRGSIKKGLLKTTGKQIFAFGCIIGATYGIDSLIGIEDNYINLHHLFCYFKGSLHYLAAIGNFALFIRM